MSYTVTPRCWGPVTGPPPSRANCLSGSDNWPLTACPRGSLSLSFPCSLTHNHTHTHTIAICFLLPCLPSISFSPLSLSLYLLPLFLWLKPLTQALPLELAVPVSPQLISEPRAGSLHGGAKRFWPLLKPWRLGAMCAAALLCCWVDAPGSSWRPRGLENGTVWHVNIRDLVQNFHNSLKQTLQGLLFRGLELKIINH